MTNLARTWAVLTTSVRAGVTAGCSSPADAPTALAKPGAGKTSYCAPLRVAVASQKKVPAGKLDQAARKKFGRLLAPVAAAAKRDGKADVAAFFTLMVKISPDPTHLTQQERTAMRKLGDKVGPVVLKDCGADVMSK